MAFKGGSRVVLVERGDKIEKQITQALKSLPLGLKDIDVLIDTDCYDDDFAVVRITANMPKGK